jgi:integrase
MSKRGRIGLEKRIGEERFKALLKSMSILDIAKQICEHQIDEEKKSACKACRRAIYRAKTRLEAAERQDKTFEPINEFEAIPEIKDFVEYCKGKKIIHFQKLKNRLFRMWQWIRESQQPKLIETQRPFLWNIKHVQYVLPKVDELKFARYGHIQALRTFFESARRHDMLKETLLAARRKDLRSPKGPKRIKDRFTIEEFKRILSVLNDEEAFMVKMHVTLKCREGDRGHGSLLDLKWSDINWEDTFYGFPMVTAAIFEPKTGGGTLWEHCPLDLWFADLSSRLKEKYQEKNGDYVFPIRYVEYTAIWNKISDAIGEDFEPHDCRRSPSGWLRDLGLSDLAIGQYDARSGRAVGYAGVGWENAEIFFQRYGKMNPVAIYKKKKCLDTAMFNGLINKISR